MVDPVLLLMIAPAVAVILVLAVLFLPKFPMGATRLPPADALARLALALRYSRVLVTEAPGHLKIRSGEWAALEVHATPSGGGSRLSFRAGMTPGAWTVVVLLVIWLGFPFLSLIGAILIVAMFLLEWRFVRRRIAPLLDGLAEPGARGHVDEIRATLVQGLSEGNRIATEAYDAERSAFGDWELVALLVAFLIWGLAFALAFNANPNPDLGVRILESTEISLFVAVGSGLALALAVYRVFRARLRELRGWMGRLEAALRAETEPWKASPEASAFELLAQAPEASAFELLAQASREVPRWVSIGHDQFFHREPGSALILVFLGFWAFWILAVGAGIALSQPVPGLLLVLAGVGLFALAYHAFRRWRRALVENAQRELESWNRRLEGLRGRMDGFLREL